MKKMTLLKILKVVSYILCLFGFILFLVFSSSSSKTDKSQGLAPVVSSISKPTSVDTPLSICLSSLSLNQNGERLFYTAIECYPKHGKLSLCSPEDQIYYKGHRFFKDYGKKFDARTIEVIYTPDKGFLGSDQFSYAAYNIAGLKSNTGVVSISVGLEPADVNNSVPMANNLQVICHPRIPVAIDLRSLTTDAGAGQLRFYFHEEDNSRFSTFEEVKYGIIEKSGLFLNYIPRRAGTENILYFVSNGTDKATAALTFIVKDNDEITWDNRHKKGGTKAFFASLSLEKRVNFLIKHFLIYFIFGGVLVLFFSFIPILSLPKRFLIITGVVFIVGGSGVILIQLFKDYYIKYSCISLFFLIMGIYFLSPRLIRNFYLLTVNFIKGNLLLVLFIFLNLLILFYHYNAITLPVFTLDAYSYMPLYNFFKYNILGFTYHDHYQRILIPWLASLLSVKSPLVAFKIINIIFINLTLLVVYKIWKNLGIKGYLVLMAVFWIVLHQYGPVRFYNFWPTSSDVGGYFFLSLLVYIVQMRKYAWLVLIAPIASLQREDFVYFVLMLLLYKAISIFVLKDKAAADRREAAIIVSSLVLTFLAFQIPKMINPHAMGGSFILARLRHDIVEPLLGSEPLKLLRLLITYFVCFGAFLLLLIQNGYKLARRNELLNILIIFSIVNVFIGMMALTERNIFLGYPFIMTLSLIVLNSLSPLLVWIGFIFSVPLLRLWVDFPFIDYPMFSEAPAGYICFYGLYMVILYVFLYYLKDLPWLEKAKTEIKE